MFRVGIFLMLHIAVRSSFDTTVSIVPTQREGFVTCKPRHCSLSLILDLNVAVCILKRTVAICFSLLCHLGTKRIMLPFAVILFRSCCYFLAHVAYWNCPWQGLLKDKLSLFLISHD